MGWKWTNRNINFIFFNYKYKFRPLLELTKQFRVRSERQPCNICKIAKFIQSK